MKRTISILVFGGAIVGLPFALGGCGDDTSNTTGGTNTTSSSSASSSGGEGGTGGTGGAGGQGGMGGMGQGGMGGMGQGGMGGSSAMCTDPGAGDACAACLYGKCNMTFCDCAAEPQCLAIAPCVQKCAQGDQACQNDCVIKNSTGFAEFILTSDCASTTCKGTCPGAGTADACQVCLAQKCEPSLEKCFGNKECVALVACVQACPAGNATCPQTCLAQHPTGAADAQTLSQCSKSSCAGTCK